MNHNKPLKDTFESKILENFKLWVTKLKEIKFLTDKHTKQKLIVNFLIKFIFLRFLENYSVIENRFIANKWIEITHSSMNKEKFNSLQKFFEEINDFFYGLFETAFFHKDHEIIHYVERDIDNLELFYQIFQNILGIASEPAIRASSTGITHYDFSSIKNDLLGKIYEMHIVEMKRERGIYYTPQFITDYIAENTVGKILDKILRKINSALQEKNRPQTDKLIEGLYQIRVFDPACGSGSFLTSALKVLWKKYLSLNTILQAERQPIIKFEDPRTLGFHILRSHIYGNDADKNAVEITKLNLWLEVIKSSPEDFQYKTVASMSDQIFPSLDLNLMHEDFLKEDLLVKAENGSGFDVIIGNPPYVPWNKIADPRKVLESGQYEDCIYDCRPNHPDSQPNLYLFFIIRAIKLLNLKGKLCFLLPQEWLYPRYSLAFRNYILEKTGDIYILKFLPDYRAFRGEEITGTSSLILLLNKTQGINFFDFQLNEREELKIRDFLLRYNIEELNNSQFEEFRINKNSIKKSELMGKRWQFLSDFFRTLMDKWNTPHFTRLDDKTYFRVFGGFQPPIETSKTFCISKAQKEIFTEKEQAYTYRVIYKASRIQRYFLDEKDVFWIILNAEFDNSEDLKKSCPHIYEILNLRIKTKREKWWEFPNVRNLKFFLHSNDKILSARTSDHNSFALDTKKHIIKGTDCVIISLKLDIKYCLGILNSKLADYYYQEYGYSYHGGERRKYEPQKVKKYMIPIKKASPQKQQILSDLVDELTTLISEKSRNAKKNTLITHNVEEKIRELDNLIDVYVFKLYDLSVDDIEHILGYLETPTSLREEIIGLYNTF